MYAVIEIDKEFAVDVCTVWPDQKQAEAYREDLAAAYEYSDGLNIKVVKVDDPLDRAGLKAIAATRKPLVVFVNE